MKLTVTTKKVAALNPCTPSFDNFKAEYPNFKGSIEKFLDLDRISHSDKLWVTLRLVPRIVLEIFAVDCAVKAVEYCENASAASYSASYLAAASAAAYAAAAVSADDAAYASAAASYVAASASTAAYAAASASTAASEAAAYAEASEAAADVAYAEHARQIEALIYLIQSHEGSSK